MDIVVNQNVTIQNKELNEITTKIRRASSNVVMNTFRIASLVATVDEKKLYEGEFEDTCDYVKKCFGLEKASTYNLIKVGRDFITEVQNGNVTNFETLLTHAGKDYSISQVFKMLPLGIEKAKELTADAVITPDMSCRAIERIVKENTEGTKSRGKSKTEPEPETEPENDEPEEIELLIEYDDVPDDVHKWLDDNFDLEGVNAVRIALN